MKKNLRDQLNFGFQIFSQLLSVEKNYSFPRGRGCDFSTVLLYLKNCQAKCFKLFTRHRSYLFYKERRRMLKSSVVLVEMARNVCILHFFLLKTVNGKAGPFGTSPKAVLSSSLTCLCLYFINFSSKYLKEVSERCSILSLTFSFNTF